MSDIRLINEEDLPLLFKGLRALSRDLGDPYPMNDGKLAEMLCGPAPIARALLAGRDEPLGLAMFTPLVSTSLGCGGAFVSDLWVAPAQRGSGLGRRLLAEVLTTAGALWDARYIRLTVYDTSPDAIRFYERLGFERKRGENAMILLPEAGKALESKR